MAVRSNGSLDSVRIGFIGPGKIGEQLIRELLETATVVPNQLIVSHRRSDRLKELRYLKVELTRDNSQVCIKADIVIICTKATDIANLLVDLQPVLTKHSTLVASIAGSILPSAIADLLPDTTRFATILLSPFLAAKRGVTGICKSRGVKDVDLALLIKLFGPLCDEILEIDEEQIDTFLVFAGSSCALFYCVLEGLILGGLMMGWPVEKTISISSRTWAGALAELNSSKKHPAILRETACTPGGMTAAGINVLEREGVRSLVAEFCMAAATKSSTLRGEIANRLRSAR